MYEDDLGDSSRQVALAVYHLHSVGIVHRDIKPENVVFENDSAESPVKVEIRRDGAEIVCTIRRDRAQVIDFGTAVAMDDADQKVRAGGRIGTWSYWAPEQLAQQPYDFAVDMWSLGVLLYILLVG